jgi:hypothetical protein
MDLSPFTPTPGMCREAMGDAKEAHEEYSAAAGVVAHGMCGADTVRSGQ